MPTTQCTLADVQGGVAQMPKWYGEDVGDNTPPHKYAPSMYHATQAQRGEGLPLFGAARRA
eukprot:907953-Alexandrium_andersonii.AAC.1